MKPLPIFLTTEQEADIKALFESLIGREQLSRPLIGLYIQIKRLRMEHGGAGREEHPGALGKRRSPK
jgi:hypothetical protein